MADNLVGENIDLNTAQSVELSGLDEAVASSTEQPALEADQDTSMLEDQTDLSAPTIKKSPQDTSTSTPAIISDNPLDAPAEPPAEPDAADGLADEEMAGMDDDDAKKEDGAEKDATEAVEGQADGQPQQTKDSIQASARSHLIQQTHQIILPSYSSWFDMNTIHSIESKYLPEFFNERNRSKTPAVYKDYRDFMVNTYRLNPAEYLTVTACRRNLAGDIDPDTRPSTTGPPFTGHFKIIADTPRGLQAHAPAPKSFVSGGRPLNATERLAAAASPSKADLNLEIRRNVYESNGKEISTSDKEKQANGEGGASTTGDEKSKDLEETLKRPGKVYYCYSCGNDCTRVRYRYFQSGEAPPGKPPTGTKYDLCSTCYMESHFPTGTSQSEYTRVEEKGYSTVPDKDAPWSDAETLALLEALDAGPNDNWDKIAEAVGSRTSEECILKFLQMEIEDPYLENDSSKEPSASLAYLANGRLGISQADNPVLSVLSFLAGLADPNVTAAAAGKSAEELRKNMRARLENGAYPGPDDKGKSKEGEPKIERESTDAMDVDTHPSPQPDDSNAVALSSNQEPSQRNSLATTALALGGARASALASHEERRITKLVSICNNLEIQKLELKMQQFSEMEAMLQAERRDLERRRHQLFLDRLAFKQRMMAVEEAMKKASLVGGEEGARMAGEVVRGNWGEKMGMVSANGNANGGEVQPIAETAPGYQSLKL
ncbi:MAG: SWI SNF, matrix associated, actin dependent regulator of chromatin, sub c, member 2 [Bogoriella megaspora]|nr:MAG: SWI SNF, matrix associated, actin dependent regulator of chromatin, sub c, member 2 [Bogoriella megaspora]